MALPSNSIFISYRKDDSAGWASQLASELRSRLGDSAVFIDDSTGIPYGSQWPDRIALALDQCRVFLPVIATSWHLERRLNDPDDWVRRELVTAHDRRGSVLSIPVFVNEAAVLKSDLFDLELKTVIDDLMTDQGLKLDRSTEHWPAKIDHLVSRIDTHLGIQSFDCKADINVEPATSDQSSRSQSNLTITSSVAGVVAVIVVAIALYTLPKTSPVENTVNNIQFEGDVVGEKVVNNRDERDVELIASQQATIDRQQATTKIDESYRTLSNKVRGSSGIAKSLVYLHSEKQSLEGIDLGFDEGIGVSLKGINMREANLSYSNFKRANLSGSDLSKTDLSFSDLSYSDLTDVDFRNSNLKGARIRGANLTGAIFDHSSMHGADLQDSYSRPRYGSIIFTEDMVRNMFLDVDKQSDADNSYVHSMLHTKGRLKIRGADIRWTNFTNTVIPFTDFNGSHLNGAVFVDSQMPFSNFAWTDLSGLNLEKVRKDNIFELITIGEFVEWEFDLENPANMTGANLLGSYFFDVNAEGLEAARSQLVGIDFYKTFSEGANFADAIINPDLSCIDEVSVLPDYFPKLQECPSAKNKFNKFYSIGNDLYRENNFDN